jgi:hypothetical protein
MAVASRFSDVSTNVEARITLLPHLAPYALWTTFHGLAGADALVSSDIDGDGANNLVEYACNLEPRLADAVSAVSGAANQGLPAAQLERLGNDSYFTVTQIRRREPAFVGLSYSLETSEDLQHWTVFQQPPRSAVQISPEWERITYSLPIPDVQNQRFCRVRVELNSIAAAPRR